MKVGRLDIDIPENWEDRSLYTFVAPAEKVAMGPTTAQTGSFRTNVVIARKRTTEGRSLQQAVQELDARTRNDFGQVEIKLDDGPSIGDTPSKRMRYVVVDPQGRALPVAQVIYVFLLDGDEWTVTWSVAAVALKDNLERFEEVMRSLAFIS